MKYSPKGGLGSDLIAVATTLIDLQEKRHSADYDPLFTVRKTDAVLVVAAGREALDRFRSASRSTRKLFTTLIFFPPK